MNGRMAKQIRKVAANPQIPEETKYKAIQHQRLVQLKEGVTGITRIQIVLDTCHRKATKVWKERFKTFRQRSDTLPNPGLNVKHMIGE